MARISDDHAKQICKFGKRETTCSFLGILGSGFECSKGTALETLIRERRRAGLMKAMGDNCSGPPDFIVTPTVANPSILAN